MAAERVEEDVKHAKQVIGDLLRELKIQRVVFVDDSFELTQNAEVAIGWFDEGLSISPDETAGLLEQVNFSVPERGWAEEFRATWANLDEKDRHGIIARLSLILGQTIAQDLGAADELRRLVPRKIEVFLLGPSTWLEQRETILSSATTDDPLLCLFDQDLSHASAAGFTADGPRSGIGLLQDVTATYEGHLVVCALLTHTLGPENEVSAWRRFSDDVGIPLGRFLPISKQRLANPLSFAAAIKKTTLNLYCERMKDGVVEVLKSASNDAATDLRKIDVYDFDQMVLRSSFKEGVSEIETLLRIYNIFHNDRVKQVFLEPARAAQFNETVERARALSRFGENLREDRPDHRWELRHQELFEEEHFVNAFYSPLRNGDLFRLDGEEQPTLILVAQPCDLMVRSNGGRGQNGEDKVADLIPIRAVAREVLGRSSVDSRLRGTLPYLYGGTDEVGVVEFARAHTVRLDVLDLAVLDREGQARLDLNNWDSIPPPQFHEAWRARRALLHQHYQQHANGIERLLPIVVGVEDAEVRKELLARVMPTVSMSELGLSSPCYEGGKFDFGIRRAGRLREPWAGRLLASYMRYRAREADQHDFSGQA